MSHTRTHTQCLTQPLTSCVCVKRSLQYISWANSWSAVVTSKSGKSEAGSGDYLYRPIGLLTRTDIAFLAAALNTAVYSAEGLEEVFGPAMVYNRAGLEGIMETQPSTNAYEWVDEQVGVLLKYGVPILAASRLEDGVSSQRQDGYLLSVPTTATTSSAMLDNITALSHGDSSVLILGRGDFVHPNLLSLVGASANVSAGVTPGFHGNASLNTRLPVPCDAASRQQMSLGPYAHVSVNDASVGDTFMTVPSSPSGSSSVIGAFATKHPSTVWAQLNDWSNSEGEDLSVADIGTLGPFQATAALVNSGQKAAVVVSGINATHPATLLAFRSRGTAKIVLGNLETPYCSSERTPPFAYSDQCAISLANPEGGYAGGARLSLSVALNTVSLGVACGSGRWSLVDLDGMQLPQVANEDASHVVRYQVGLDAREAHAFELRCQ